MHDTQHLLSPTSGPARSILRDLLGVEENFLDERLTLGSIYINQKRIREWTSLQAGDYVRIHLNPKRYPVDFDWTKLVVRETDDFVVANKPPGLPVPPTVDNLVENLSVQLGRALGVDLHVTHRLDVPTRGLIVLAKNKAFQAYFNQLLSERKIRKTYLAEVEGQSPPRLGLHRHFMRPSPRAPKELLETPQEGWEECLLEITQIEQQPSQDRFRITIELITGRTHQIRAQLARLGCPLAGDLMYGSRTEAPFFLQCRSLIFRDRGQDVTVELN